MRFEENQMQTQIVTWFRVQFPRFKNLLYHIPNGQNVGLKAGARLKRAGLVSGIPDLHLAYPTRMMPGLYLELKTSRGIVSPRQRAIHEQLKNVGYRVEVVRSFEEGAEVIQEYLGPDVISLPALPAMT